jgi:HlyD family secretion protein
MLAAQAISQSQLDATRTAASTAASRADAITQSIALLKAGTREERIRAARADVNAARASLAAALAASADLVLTSPISGVVLTRHVEAGEVVAAGVPSLTLGDVHKPWVRVFVAAPALPKLHPGQEVLASLSGAPDQLFSGRIVSIDSRAQFTPRIALTEDERADLMFGVKVELVQEGALVKPGLPIDVHFDTAGTGFPAALTSGKTIHKPARPNGGG